MTGIKRSDNINAVIIKGISVALVFAAAVIILICAIFAFLYEGDILSTLNTRFFCSALSVLFVSSVIYTPFSYGISYYFLRSRSGDSDFLHVFYLFRTPRLLLKAVFCDLIRRTLITLLRIALLISAAVLELMIIQLVVRDSSLLIILHVFSWGTVLFLMFVIKIRFILCKYVLIQYPCTSIAAAIRSGLSASRGHTPAMIRFYVKYLAVYIFTFLTLGMSRARKLSRTRESFCTFAVSLVKRQHKC